MRVLKKPSVADWSMESECRGGCGTYVELGARDLAFVPDHRDGNAVTWMCPTCGHTTWIAATKVPAYVLVAVRR